MFRNDQCGYQDWTSLEHTYIKSIHGIEVQIQSLNQPNCSSWILTCRGLERFVNELHSYDSEIFNPSSSLLKPRNDPEHVVMAPETPCTGRPVRGRQDSERNERDSDPARTRGGEPVHTRTIQSPWYIYQG